jgi:hypothetical protein
VRSSIALVAIVSTRILGQYRHSSGARDMAAAKRPAHHPHTPITLLP